MLVPGFLKTQRLPTNRLIFGTKINNLKKFIDSTIFMCYLNMHCVDGCDGIIIYSLRKYFKTFSFPPVMMLLKKNQTVWKWEIAPYLPSLLGTSRQYKNRRNRALKKNFMCAPLLVLVRFLLRDFENCINNFHFNWRRSSFQNMIKARWLVSSRTNQTVFTKKKR